MMAAGDCCNSRSRLRALYLCIAATLLAWMCGEAVPATASVDEVKNESGSFSCSKKFVISPEKWAVLSDVVSVLSSLSADYNLHGGTLLDFIRDCEVKDSDIDIAISLEWWRSQNNALALENALKDRGFAHNYKFGSFGKMGEFGYEIAWRKDGVKVDLFSRIDMPNQYATGLWIQGMVYKCHAQRREFALAKWNGLDVRIPTPPAEALTSWYGPTWRTPWRGVWRWDVEPFTVGSCRVSKGQKKPAVLDTIDLEKHAAPQMHTASLHGEGMKSHLANRKQNQRKALREQMTAMRIDQEEYRRAQEATASYNVKDPSINVTEILSSFWGQVSELAVDKMGREFESRKARLIEYAAKKARHKKPTVAYKHEQRAKTATDYAREEKEFEASKLRAKLDKVLGDEKARRLNHGGFDDHQHVGAAHPTDTTFRKTWPHYLERNIENARKAGLPDHFGAYSRGDSRLDGLAEHCDEFYCRGMVRNYQDSAIQSAVPDGAALLDNSPGVANPPVPRTNPPRGIQTGTTPSCCPKHCVSRCSCGCTCGEYFCSPGCLNAYGCGCSCSFTVDNLLPYTPSYYEMDQGDEAIKITRMKLRGYLVQPYSIPSHVINAWDDPEGDSVLGWKKPGKVRGDNIEHIDGQDFWATVGGIPRRPGGPQPLARGTAGTEGIDFDGLESGSYLDGVYVPAPFIRRWSKYPVLAPAIPQRPFYTELHWRPFITKLNRREKAQALEKLLADNIDKL